MNKLQKLLQEKKVLVADGAWGTELMKKGLKTGEIPEEWNFKEPDRVKEIARSYIDVGADIILTNTFEANKLISKMSDDAVEKTNIRGVLLSKEEAGKSLVFASIGPTGEFLKPIGNFDETDLIGAYVEQVKGIVKGGADGIIIETMSDIKEALCAFKEAKQNSSLPVGISFSFYKSKTKGFATMMGTTPEQVVKAFEKENLSLIGANCGSVTVEDMVAIAGIMRSITGIPLWIKPNAGLPVLKEGKTFYPQTPEQLASFVPRLIESGARVIGGCCGTTPEHIKQIRNEVDKYLGNHKI